MDVKKILIYGMLSVTVIIILTLGWLRWESHNPREQWFIERHGQLLDVAVSSGITPRGQLTEQLELTSSSGLRVVARLIRDNRPAGQLPVLVVLGGHRTGSDAVDLFGKVDKFAVVGVDYPYDGPQRVSGVMQTLAAIMPVRRAFLDTVPAVSLVIDWLVQQSWVDSDRLIIVGGSLGVPFAATAAANDARIGGAILAHGAVDNQLWIEAQLARRIDTTWLHYPLSVLLHWLAYGPVHDTRENVVAIAPRPVLIIGARNDERTPAGQSEKLYELAGEPKRLRYTDGAHVQPDRPEIIADLLRIADEEMPFLIKRVRVD